MKRIKLILVVISGLLLGLVIHGLIEIPALWLLTNRFDNLFARISWSSWLRIHLVFSVVTEALGVILVLWISKKKS